MDYDGSPLPPEAFEPPGYTFRRFDRECGVDYTTGGHDPSSTSCDQKRGHAPATPHEGPDPLGGGGRVRWRGGGFCAGDPVRPRDVQWIYPAGHR